MLVGVPGVLPFLVLGVSDPESDMRDVPLLIPGETDIFQQQSGEDVSGVGLGHQGLSRSQSAKEEQRAGNPEQSSPVWRPLS